MQAHGRPVGGEGAVRGRGGGPPSAGLRQPVARLLRHPWHGFLVDPPPVARLPRQPVARLPRRPAHRVPQMVAVLLYAPYAPPPSTTPTQPANALRKSPFHSLLRTTTPPTSSVTICSPCSSDIATSHTHTHTHTSRAGRCPHFFFSQSTRVREGARSGRERAGTEKIFGRARHMSGYPRQEPKLERNR